MRKTAVLSFIFLTGLVAQTVETIPFRAILSSANEVPAVTPAASGAATILLHVVRDASGNITSGSADAIVSYNFPGSVTLTAMHIHQAPAGVAGAVILPWALARTTDDTGVGALPTYQSQFPNAGTSLDIVNQIIANPSGFYFNIHSTDNAGGAMRGQLQRAEMFVRMGFMGPQNETPPIAGNAGVGTSVVSTYMTRDAVGNPTSALVVFDLAYSGLPDGAMLTGYHIHLGGAGIAGPVTINTGLRSLAVPAGGSGRLHYEIEANTSQQAVVDTLNAMAYTPWNTYINAHTSDFPGGLIRSQLMSTDRTDFQVMMSPANEVPAVTGTTALAAAAVKVFTVRNADATVAGGAVIFDINPRFASGSTFTGLHIHDGIAGVNGPVTIDSGLNNLPQIVADGTGNIYRVAIVNSAAGLATLNSLLMNPEKHYVNIHTSDSPGGAARSQLVAANTALPKITFVETAVQDPTVTTLAPGGLTLIAGSNLAKAADNLNGFNGASNYPWMLNGTQVTIGGKQAAIYSVAPDRVFAQVPVDVAVGSQPVVVTNSNGASAAFNVMIAAVAPAIFINGDGAVAIRATDGRFITRSNPAKAGDGIAIIATGLGLTTPTQQTGVIAGTTPYITGSVTVKIGSQSVPVASAAALPGYAGVYAIGILLPSGLGTGDVPVVLQMGNVMSNTTTIPLQ